jgi:hypothetical protein
MLRNFQNNLANISNEIRHLQHYSAELNIKKKNRELVRGQLSQVVDEMVVPQSMIQSVIRRLNSIDSHTNVHRNWFLSSSVKNNHGRACD